MQKRIYIRWYINICIVNGMLYIISNLVFSMNIWLHMPIRSVILLSNIICLNNCWLIIISSQMWCIPRVHIRFDSFMVTLQGTIMKIPFMYFVSNVLLISGLICTKASQPKMCTWSYEAGLPDQTCLGVPPFKDI